MRVRYAAPRFGGVPVRTAGTSPFDVYGCRESEEVALEAGPVSLVVAGDNPQKGLSSTLMVFARARKRKCEARAFTFATLDGEIAFHCPREVAAYRQPQSNAAFPIRETFLQLDEWREDGFQFVRGNA
jgi:hypothetical protein